MPYLSWQGLKLGGQSDQIEHGDLQFHAIVDAAHQKLVGDVVVALAHLQNTDALVFYKMVSREK